jgi:hypothetical protein
MWPETVWDVNGAATFWIDVNPTESVEIDVNVAEFTWT